MVQILRFILRIAGLAILACAVIAIVADAGRSIGASDLVFMPIGQLWFDLSRETLNLAQAAVQRHVSPVLWDPVIMTVLTWPVWAVATPLGLVCLALGTGGKSRSRSGIRLGA
ncbi:hypothetical protein GCM10011316_32510 [Roseibium aquae]|uniref:PetM family of cytochrome b6f complex subunit 7 n=1 Tax=Roseibium aquae TaxID=1323746 RepID=A0A916X1Z5_9HYPH|nr:hypothetical protein [Roseibium aquae]GGB57922.1 hypothetical protein GCM10011316_32510 [Roseibium aquae]